MTHNLHKTLSGSDTPATLFRQAQAPHRQEFQLAISIFTLVSCDAVDHGGTQQQ